MELGWFRLAADGHRDIDGLDLTLGCSKGTGERRKQATGRKRYNPSV